MALEYCEVCKSETEHKEMLLRKPSRYDNNKSFFGRFMLFIHEFVNGGNYHNMDRHIKCGVCGNKAISNTGTEFE